MSLQQFIILKQHDIYNMTDLFCTGHCLGKGNFPRFKAKSFWKSHLIVNQIIIQIIPKQRQDEARQVYLYSTLQQHSKTLNIKTF